MFLSSIDLNPIIIVTTNTRHDTKLNNSLDFDNLLCIIIEIINTNKTKAKGRKTPIASSNDLLRRDYVVIIPKNTKPNDIINNRYFKNPNNPAKTSFINYYLQTLQHTN